MARPEFDIVVIGGGAGGLVVAAGGASLGAKVALVETPRLGGDCLWTGCVPSKTLIKSAQVAHAMRHADRWAIPAHAPQPDLAQVMERVASVIRGIEPNDSPERFRGLGVDVILGDGRFMDPQTFVVGGRRLSAKTYVIATGSRPAMPPVPGLVESGALTNETLFDLREPVAHLIVIGSGPIGSEMAQAFRRLGSEVDVVDVGARILPREDADVAAVVQRAMAAEGVRHHFGASIVRVDGRRGDLAMTIRDKNAGERTIAGSHILVAAGRKPNVENLGLEAAGVRTDNGRIVVDEKLRTTHPGIFVVGDVAGGYQFTHVAEHHAGVVLRQAVFKLFWTRPSKVVPWCTYTDPELARVGLSEDEAKERRIAHKVYRFAFDEIDRARAEGETEGFAKLVTDPKGRILGAAIVGPHAGELIAEAVLAISKGMKAGDLSAAIHTYPTLASINRRVADQKLKEGLTPTAKVWIRRIFGLAGA